MWCVEEGDGDIQNYVYASGLFHSGHFDLSVGKAQLLLITLIMIFKCCVPHLVMTVSQLTHYNVMKITDLN